MRHQAILLIGPTGSGKSPLGQWLETHGLAGRRCHHFDFGANLRGAASGKCSGFVPAETAFLRDVLERGALLENEMFYIALKILDAFIAQRRVQPDGLLVMNGLPRHAGQAGGLRERLEFVAVVHLVCNAATVLERLRRNTGGDRTARDDDARELVGKKLRTFHERTAPLIEHYRQRGVPVAEVSVGVETQPAEMAKSLFIVAT
jgi:adenylate kinase family enzyme